MSRASQTEMAVLGGLSVEPMTGYRLREEIRDVLGHFWSESFGQIYPALSRLEAQGFVRRTGSSRVGASVFEITRAGRGRLRELLGEPIQSVPPRNGLMLRLFFGRQLGPTRCRELILASKADAEALLAGYGAIRDELEAGQGADRDYWLLTLSAGEHTARAAIAWADQSLEALDSIDGRRRLT